jgi:hypothetical protein
MPKVKVLQSNFSAGELSPQAAGRVDIARYPNAAKSLVNVISRTLGGAKKRPGTQYLAGTKTNAKRSRLIPYVISRDKAYMLELGDLYMRVFKPDGTQVAGPYEIVTPYTESYVTDLDYTQGEDSMFMFHSSIYPNRLRNFADAKWDCSVAPFTTTPFTELGDYPAVALTLSANTVGTGRTMTAASAVFLASDVGRAILWNAGIFVITAYTDTTHVTGEVKVIFDATAIPSGSWNLDSSPQTTCTPSAKDPVGAAITLTLAAAGWRTTDAGKFVRLNGGLTQISTFSSDTVVNAIIKQAMTSAVGAPALSWTLEGSMWSATNGYPRTGAIHQQRLVVGGTTKNPQTVCGSRSGEPLDFTKGTNDDDAFVFTIGTSQNQVNLINFLASSRDLLVLTYGGEFSMRSGIEKPLTPTNVQIKPEGPAGSSTVRPVQVGKETLFAQRAGRKLRAMGYHYDEDGYKSPDLATLAEHITETGIACMAFQQEPEPVVWIALKNGRLISLTLDRDLDVIAWNQHEMDGGVESVATIPYGDIDQVWLIVRRSVNGSTVRYVERLQPDWYPVYGTASPDYNTYPVADEPVNWGYQLDCAITQDDAVGKTVWGNLTYLQGKTVRCIADGVDMGYFVVAAGQITLPRAAKRTLIGLMFVPVVKLLRPEIAGGGGTVQADAMSTSEFVIRVHNTIGAVVNDEQVIPGRINGPAQLDFAPELFTGDKACSLIGWTKGDSEVVITQDAPFPFHLLATIRTLTVNGG